jgi:multidrug efflux system membrane fusion protein
MTTPSVSTDRPRRKFFWFAAIAIVVFVSVAIVWRRADQPARAAPSPSAVPVTVAPVERQDVPVLLTALGTVQASQTVAIRSQVDGKLQSVNFVEGQNVHQGDVLAVIDPRSFQAALDQAVAKKAQDEAQLTSAAKDLARFKDLTGKGFATQQGLDQQQGKVDQLKGAIDADAGAIESARTQLSYTSIVAPIEGRIGFRQVDAGNIIHANDQNPLTVITQIRPSVSIFTLPQKNLYDVRDAMQRGNVPVIAFDQDDKRELARGTLLLVDNQIDQTTSTIKLKASFPNENEALWPGAFVRLRVQVDTRKDAITIPPAALQRGPQGLFVWVIKPDSTAEQRAVEATPFSEKVVVVTHGLSDGEHVVVNGQYRLQRGSRVEIRTGQARFEPGRAS